MWGRVLQTLSQEAAYIHDARFDAPSRGVKEKNERIADRQISLYEANIQPVIDIFDCFFGFHLTSKTGS
ncbi:hypothetical protein AF72_01480 [Xylella taiwanensis]|uniref:Uncharacterized protein n=1 Tax=Xylella taiwanensis TaxID=1444770 RepID=Z9JMM8_9GAMM|nr:hypothetical protein AB672_04910 [Xylella taiwanensis]EWS79258.1 hypothetical protein AF72_01480 [Xylella taiwanensis]